MSHQDEDIPIGLTQFEIDSICRETGLDPATVVAVAVRNLWITTFISRVRGKDFSPAAYLRMLILPPLVTRNAPQASEDDAGEPADDSTPADAPKPPKPSEAPSVKPERTSP